MRRNIFWKIPLGQVAVVCVLVGAWQLLAMRAGPVFLPGPASALSTLLDGLHRRWMVPHLWTTLLEVLGGYAWAVAIGLSLGFLLGASPLLFGAYESPLLNLYAIPKVTLFPLFLAAFKLGISSKIAFGAFHGLFPVAIYTWTAMRTMNPVHLKVARVLGLGPLATFRRVVFPAVLPGIVTGLRLGFNLTLLGVVLGEMFASRAGMGFLLMSFGAAFDASRILAVILVLFMIALIGNAILLALERRVKGVPELHLHVS
ncbi:MAG: ABC transporter permease subunit [Armatimonadota bacterium]|nr:ABC transporter permease subunit [Armatimonadota bacterium]MDR5704237.1 ABC transporter permease subunit [Armatimonadota bacterium]